MGLVAGRAHSPPFKGGVAAQRPGWLEKGRVASLYARDMLAQRSLFCLKLLTTAPAPLRNGIFLLMAQPPLLEKEGNELASTSVIDFEIACLRQLPEIRRLCAPLIHTFHDRA